MHEDTSCTSSRIPTPAKKPAVHAYICTPCSTKKPAPKTYICMRRQTRGRQIDSLGHYCVRACLLPRRAAPPCRCASLHLHQSHLPSRKRAKAKRDTGSCEALMGSRGVLLHAHTVVHNGEKKKGKIEAKARMWIRRKRSGRGCCGCSSPSGLAWTSVIMTIMIIMHFL